MKILCWYCHKPCSNILPDDTIFRAIAVCPECLAKSPESKTFKKLLYDELHNMLKKGK